MDEKNHFEHNESQTEIPTAKRSGSRSILGRPFIIVVLTIVAAALICVVISFSFFTDTVTSGNQEHLPSSTPEILTNSTEHQFEEEQKNNLEDIVKKADLALIKTLEETGVDMKELQLEDVSLKRFHNRDYHYQKLRFPPVKDPDIFFDNVNSKLSKLDANATLNKEKKDCWLLTINGVETHKIFMKTSPKIANVISAESPKMAIVIDDMGEDVSLAKGLIKTGLHITFSIWPSSSHAHKIAHMARKNGNEIMIHMPMQPQGYPKVHPGKDALLMGMKHDQIVQLVDQAFKNVPGAVGLNNHMGSRFTEDIYGMKAVMESVKKHKLFFLDSKTTPNSICPKACAELRVPLYERNIFLDNVKDISAIEFQLEKAEKIALKHGQSIAIGHPHPQTLEAIKRWAASKDKNLFLVPVHSLKSK